MKGLSYTQERKTTINADDTGSADYIFTGIQAALPPNTLQPPTKSRDTCDSLYWDRSLRQNCQQWCSQLV